MVLQDRIGDIADRLLAGEIDLVTTPIDELDVEQRQDAILVDFVSRHPGVETLSAVEQENLFIEDQVRLLGFNPTLRTGFGTGEDALASRNEGLRASASTCAGPLSLS